MGLYYYFYHPSRKKIGAKKKKKKKKPESAAFTMFKPSLQTLSHQEMDDAIFLIS